MADQRPAVLSPIDVDLPQKVRHVKKIEPRLESELPTSMRARSWRSAVQPATPRELGEIAVRELLKYR